MKRLSYIIKEEFLRILENYSIDFNVFINEGDSKYLKTKRYLSKSKVFDDKLKNTIIELLNSSSKFDDKKNIIKPLNKPENLKKKCKEVNGVSLGADKDGFFVYTHRARSKSYSSPDDIAIKDIKFIELTG